MATLYLRDVPDTTVEQLRRIASRARMSVNAVAVQQLIEAGRQVDNPALFESLPDLGVDVGAIVAGLADERSQR